MPDDWNELAWKIGYENEKDMWEKLYILEECSVSELSRRFNCATFTIMRHLEAAGIKRRRKGGNNNPARQTYKLFHCDQRVVLFLNLDVLAETMHVSRSLCYKYRSKRLGGISHEVLYHQPDSGVGEVCNSLQNTPSPAAVGQDPGVSRVLPPEEE